MEPLELHGTQFGNRCIVAKSLENESRNQFFRLSNSDNKIAIFISTFHKHIIDELILGKGLAMLGTE